MKRFLIIVTTICVVAITVTACFRKDNSEIKLLDESQFKNIVDNRDVKLYTLKSGNLTMQVTNFGARVIALWVPDKKGKLEDVVLGYDNIDKYLNNTGERFLGACVGRYANRIAKGKFYIDGQKYQLSTYNNGQCLHGGDKGFDMVIWDVKSVTDDCIVFFYESKDMEEGFPGNLSVTMTYRLTPDNEFKIHYRATTDKKTVVNLSHHSFFNLKGEGCGSILDHVLVINSDFTTPVDSFLIPTGKTASVESTPFDFRKPHQIGERINDDNIQLKNGGGYDHNWILNRNSKDDIEFAASLYEPQSGRFMEIFTDQPAIQFYSGNFFDGKSIGKYSRPFQYRGAVALETQKYPDSPNHQNFPTTLLNPGETYTHTCIYKFSIK